MEMDGGLLRNRSFMLVFIGMAISLLGDSLYAMVIPLWVLRTAGSATAVAAITAVGSVISLLLAPVAGTVADRTDRRRQMIRSDLGRGAITLLLAWVLLSGHGRYGYLLLGAAGLATANAFFGPAYAAAQSGLVHPDDLTRALSLFQLMRQTISFVGPPFAGVVVAYASSGGALGLDAVSFFFAAACVSLARLEWNRQRSKERRPFWLDFRRGMGVVAADGPIRRILVLTVGVNFAGAMFGVLLPVIAIREWQLTSAQYGLFNTVSPAGTAVGMALIAWLGRRLQQRGRFMLLALIGMGVLNIGMGVAVGTLPFAGLLFLSGVAFGLSNTLFAVMYRQLVPQEQQGRFFGLMGALTQALAPAGMAISGVLADRISPFQLAAGAGVIVVLLAVWGLRRPGLRDIR